MFWLSRAAFCAKTLTQAFGTELISQAFANEKVVQSFATACFAFAKAHYINLSSTCYLGSFGCSIVYIQYSSEPLRMVNLQICQPRESCRLPPHGAVLHWTSWAGATPSCWPGPHGRTAQGASSRSDFTVVNTKYSRGPCKSLSTPTRATRGMRLNGNAQ